MRTLDASSEDRAFDALLFDLAVLQLPPDVQSSFRTFRAQVEFNATREERCASVRVDRSELRNYPALVVTKEIAHTLLFRLLEVGEQMRVGLAQEGEDNNAAS